MIKSHLGKTGDRVLWGALLVLGAIVLGGVLASPPPLPPLAQSTGDALVYDEQSTLEGRVTRVLSEQRIEMESGDQFVQQVEVEITAGDRKGERVVAEQGGMFLAGASALLKPGMRVVVARTETPAGERYDVRGPNRRAALAWLTVLFVVVTVVVGRWTGARSLLGLAFSVLVIAQFIVPRLLAGHDPVGVSIAGALILMAPSLYLVYGWRGKTHAAVLGMTLSLLLTWLLAAVFVSWTRITGFGDESVGFLTVALQVELDPRGLVLAGIVLGTLGMLDDIAIGLASAVFELYGANPDLSRRELFRKSMIIGVDHFASMVNSLMLAYVGASLPLFLLLAIYQEPLAQTLNREFLVEELVRTLVGGAGLMLTGPVTSAIACWMVKRGKEEPSVGGGQPIEPPGDEMASESPHR